MTKLSIIIVAYRNMDCLADCLASIPDLPWIEVIVVNNTHQNRGFGAGCNLGVKMAKSENLLFMNPDATTSAQALKQVVTSLETETKIGILGPALTDINGQIVLSISQQPKVTNAWVVYSLLNRLWSNLKVVKEHWYQDVDKSKRMEVGIVSGAVMGMKKEVFSQVGGFDEQFFLYWEEVDLAKRVIEAGYRVIYDPNIKFFHHGALSTLQPHQTTIAWFRESRFLYFRKHFGLIGALLTEGFLAASEHWSLTITLLGIYLFSLTQAQELNSTIILAGAIVVITMVYNEMIGWGEQNASLIAFSLGVWIILSDQNFKFLGLLLGGLWIIFDLVPSLKKFRRVFVILAVGLIIYLNGILKSC